MWHRVAALLGRSVAEAQASITSAEFSDWCAYFSVEPWGYGIENWRMGVVAATVANYSGNVKKAVKVSDFLPRKPKKLTPDQQRDLLKRMAPNG